MNRNLIRSLVGGVIPAVVGVVGTLVAVNFADSSGRLALLLAWTVLGYLTLTDFGLTRSASKIASSRDTTARELVAALWRISIPLAVVVTIALAFAISLMGGSKDLYFLLPTPLLAALQFPLVGILEARGAFGYLAMQRSVNAIASYLVPAVLVASIPSSLPFALALISVSRFVLLLAICIRLKIAPLSVARSAFTRNGPIVETKSLVPWLALSSLIGPLLLYADRLILSGYVDSNVWVFYTATSEILLKSYIIPTALVAVWFPWLAANARNHVAKVRERFILLLPLLTILGAVASGLISYFVFPDLVFEALGAEGDWMQTARLILAISLAATVINWSSQLYIALLQALDAQKFVGLVQISIAAPYIAGLVAAAATGGAVFVAVASLLRIGVVWLALVLQSASRLKRAANE